MPLGLMLAFWCLLPSDGWRIIEVLFMESVCWERSLPGFLLRKGLRPHFPLTELGAVYIYLLQFFNHIPWMFSLCFVDFLSKVLLSFFSLEGLINKRNHSLHTNKQFQFFVDDLTYFQYTVI